MTLVALYMTVVTIIYDTVTHYVTAWHLLMLWHLYMKLVTLCLLV